jgi:predicted dehydrogenase/threonine dehydrogenase-like Zn-dependent dehydrogenase
MKQLLQSLKTGTVELASVAAPGVQRGRLLVVTRRSLISAGTERMLLDFGKAGFIEKARQQPDKVRMVLDKMRTDGIAATVSAVLDKLDQPLALGYCNVGVVSEAGEDVSAFGPGDRVVSNAKHAEVVSVPPNLCARVPDAVSDDEAVFAVVGAIALQGIRLAQPSLGEAVVVTGLGLIGLLTVQLLRAHGCRVLGVDYEAARLRLAESFGADTVDLSTGADPVKEAMRFSRERGVDAVIIAASTKSSEPVHQAAAMCRKRGRVVLVGVTGLELSRQDFYEKELTFQVSCSYGPGRYDRAYEEEGHDYPIGFVRWTEQRNFEAVLDLIADGRLDVKPLVSHRFSIEDAQRAYDTLAARESSLGILLEYPGSVDAPRERTVRLKRPPEPSSGEIGVSFIGAGNYAAAVLIPAFKAAGAGLRAVASSTGVSGMHAARKFGFADATTDVQSVLDEPRTNAVVIATRHDSHAHLAVRALAAGKHVFVEKPLCLNLEELERIAEAVQASDRFVMVGFNRRFAPHTRIVKQLLSTVREPKTLVMTVNAGSLARDHWTQDRTVGGGRIVGEACHFIDLLRHLAGSPIIRWHGSAVPSSAGPVDTASITLEFGDGSLGTVHYFANGHRSFDKERLEIFAGGRIVRLENFRRLTSWGWGRLPGAKLWRQDKGQFECASAFVRAIAAGSGSPIPWEETAEVTRISIEVGRMLEGRA